MDEYVEANNQFACDLYERFRKSDGNIFFSPYSITTAMGMTLEGAVGETAEEMRDVLHQTMSDDERRESVKSLYDLLNPEDAEFALETANALWVQDGYDLLEDYVNTVQDAYGGEARTVDFINATGASRQLINNWVEGKTQDKIKELLKPGTLNELTRLVLTNAIYFKGNWKAQFDEDLTRDEDFWLDGDNSIEVPMMRQTANYGYHKSWKWQALEMPYEGDELSMLVLLPNAQSLDHIERELSPEMLDEVREQMQYQKVNAFLPKFTFTEECNLKQTLSAMGMPLAFSNNADFSGINGEKDLSISEVIHKAFVEVNEEGTEAAAATAVVMRTLGAVMPSPIPEFRADHPFLFLIQEKSTGNVLFMGRVENPEG